MDSGEDDKGWPTTTPQAVPVPAAMGGDVPVPAALRHCTRRKVALGEWTAQEQERAAGQRVAFERQSSPVDSWARQISVMSWLQGGPIIVGGAPTSPRRGSLESMRTNVQAQDGTETMDSMQTMGLDKLQRLDSLRSEANQSECSVKRRWGGLSAVTGFFRSVTTKVPMPLRRRTSSKELTSEADRSVAEKSAVECLVAEKSVVEQEPPAVSRFMSRRASTNMELEARAELEVIDMNLNSAPTWQIVNLDASTPWQQNSAKAAADANPEATPKEEKAVSIKSINVLESLGRRCATSTQVIVESQRKLHECYVFHAVLGKGSFGEVSKATLKVTGAVRAVKAISKERMKDKMTTLKRELTILKRLDHPGILRLHELFEDDDKIYIITELCHGGDLLGQIKQCGRFLEEHARKVMAQIFRAVYYLHGIRVCHRDLKPENCLFSTTESPLSRNSSLRVADFGLSCSFQPGQVLKTRVGTTAFMSPQVIARQYNEACDLWSCGCISYMLLCGYLPYRGKNEAEVRQKVQDDPLRFPASDWAHVSGPGMDLVSRLLNKDQDGRANAETALNHEWVRDALSEETEKPIEAKIIQSLRGFRSLNRFKRAALQVVASLLNEEQTRAPREAFVALDFDGDGFVSLFDLRRHFRTTELMQAVDAGDQSARELLKFLDGRAGPWKHSSYTEFIAANFDRRTYCNRSICRAAFSTFDLNQDGAVSVKELSKGHVLGDLDDAEIERLVKDLDQNKDGEIDFEEFIDMMRDGEGFVETHSSGARKKKSSPKSGSSGKQSPPLTPSGDSWLRGNS